jgi:hypothetical protein
MRIGIAREPSAPELEYSGFPLDAPSVGRRGRVFEDGVFGHERRQRVSVMTIERLVEAVHGRAGGLVLWLRILIVPHGNLMGLSGRQQAAQQKNETRCYIDDAICGQRAHYAASRRISSIVWRLSPHG